MNKDNFVAKVVGTNTSTIGRATVQSFDGRPLGLGMNLYAEPQTNFKFELGDEVVISSSGEFGKIVGRAEYEDGVDSYYVHYKAADGRAVTDWWNEKRIELKAEDGTAIGRVRHFQYSSEESNEHYFKMKAFIENSQNPNVSLDNMLFGFMNLSGDIDMEFETNIVTNGDQSVTYTKMKCAGCNK